MKANTFRPTPTGSNDSASSTGTADVKSLVAPAGAQAVLLSVETTGCYATLDGTTPDATHGIFLTTGAVHFLYVGSGLTLKFASSAAAASKVNVIWLA